jgi:hypothetical protein
MIALELRQKETWHVDLFATFTPSRPDGSAARRLLGGGAGELQGLREHLCALHRGALHAGGRKGGRGLLRLRSEDRLFRRQEPCQEPTETSGGKQIRSRYFPVKSYVICDNDRPWAWCLDKPCIIDKDNPAKASCACTTVKKQGPYVIVADTYTDTACTTGIISSATVTQDHQVTDFLKSSSELKPFDVKVLNPK